MPGTVPAFGEHPDKLRHIPNIVDELMPLLDLHVTANSGCTRCIIILEAVNTWENAAGDFHHVEYPGDYVIGIAPMPKPGAKAARTGARGLAISVTRKEGWEHHKHLTWVRNDFLWDFDVKFDLYTEWGDVLLDLNGIRVGLISDQNQQPGIIIYPFSRPYPQIPVQRTSPNKPGFGLIAVLRTMLIAVRQSSKSFLLGSSTSAVRRTGHDLLRQTLESAMSIVLSAIVGA